MDFKPTAKSEKRRKKAGRGRVISVGKARNKRLPVPRKNRTVPS